MHTVMIRRIKDLLQTLFGGQMDFQERMVRMVLASAFIASLIGMGRVLIGADSAVMPGLLSMCGVSCAALWIAVQKRRPRKASWVLILLTNVILFPPVFFLSGGVQSGMPIWFVLGLVYVFLLFRGREFYLALAISVLSFAGTFAAAIRFPGLVLPVENRYYNQVDSCITLFTVSGLIGILLKAQSVTYEKEKRLAEQRREEIEQLARSKDNFFANMSHEIRTPINTIIGLNEMTLRENISEEIAENAVNIQNASKMLLTTINDILDLSKLESGKMDIVPVQYEVSAMFSDLVNLIWIRAHQKELEFKVAIDQELPSMLYGDEVRIKQVVTNMLTNAIKYTETGSVTLSAKGERVAADAIMLRISVEDTGVGIRKESLNDLFSSFKRVDEKSNRNIEGTGLGLTISKQLMEKMGGRIFVDSVYHKGSVFTIELRQRIVNARPIGVINFAAQKQAGHRVRYRQSFIAPDAKVLVVDDNDMNRMVVKKLLRGTEVKVDMAESGRECLRKTAEGSYHVILMDHMMPGMDGEETMKAVRTQARGYCQKTPIIALTANVMTNGEGVYREMGFDGYLAKPINAALLEAGLMKYLPPELIEYMAGDQQTEGEEENLISQVAGARKRRVAITADCICDLPRELLDRLQISLMYCYVHTREGRFCDLTEVTSDGLLHYLNTEGNYAHSSTAPPEEYEYFFADALERAEQVIHITATSDLSGAYPYALRASQSFDNVTVVDSGHISSGHGIMVLYAAVLAEEGKEVEEICQALEECRENVCSNFFVPNTATLHRNKKVSGAVHTVCSVLGLRPVLYMSRNRLKVWKIEMGSVQWAGRRYVRALFHNSRQIDTSLLFLTYAGCSIRQLDEILAEVEKYVKFERVILQKASATVSSNCGVGIFGLMFARKRKE